jgi:cysteine desulfurase
MLPHSIEAFGNTSGIQSCGQKAKGAIEEARVKVAKFIGVGFQEIVFTSGGTQADSCALKGLIHDRKDNRNTGSAFRLPASFPGY